MPIDLTPTDTIDYLSTIYVVTWKPQSIGGFEWFNNRPAAAAYARDLQDPTVRISVVAVPPRLASDAWGITEWLHDDGWYDGPVAPAHRSA